LAAVGAPAAGARETWPFSVIGCAASGFVVEHDDRTAGTRPAVMSSGV
jgi:hypothetical protein